MSSVDLLVSAAAFSKEDIDAATSGLCGTFALAMKDVMPDLRIQLLCLDDKNGKAQYLNGIPHWRHVVVEDDKGDLFDITGRVSLKEIIDNYCWGNIRGDGGILVEVEVNELRHLLEGNDDAFDAYVHETWVERLKDVPAQTSQSLLTCR